MKGLIGKKAGMTSMFDEAGNHIVCTVIEAEPNVVTQVKTEETDGYNAIQVGFNEAKEKNTSAAMKGHFNKAGVAPQHKVVEFRDFEVEKAAGEEITVELFAEGEDVSVVGTSKGKGFQGVVKRHGFGGVGMRTHGQHNRERSPGSIGGASYPARVFKGMRMAGRTGGSRVKQRGSQIVKVIPEKNLILVKGSVPGHCGAYVIVEKK